MRESNVARSRRNRRRVGRRRGIHRVRRHLGPELVSCFVLDGWNCIPAIFSHHGWEYIFCSCPVLSSAQPLW